MRKKVYAAWILAIIMVMSGVLCTQAETVFTGKAHGSKVNTTGETTPTEAEKQFEEAEQIYVTVRYSSDWEYSEYSYSSDYGSYVELSIPDDGIYVRINASINTPLDYASELYDFGINAYDVIVEDSCETVSIGGMEFVQGENDYYKAFFGYDQESAMYAKIMVYGDPEDPRVTELIDNVTFHKKEYTKTKTPWYWDGEVYVPKDTEPVQVGNFTVEAEYLPIDTVYPPSIMDIQKQQNQAAGIMYLQMETLASTMMKMEDSHMKEMSILILMLKISLETKMEICMHLEMADRLFDGVQKRMKCCLITA